MIYRTLALHVGAYPLEIITAELHKQDWSFTQGSYHSARNYHGSKQWSKKYPVCKKECKMILKEKAVTKSRNKDMSIKVHIKHTKFNSAEVRNFWGFVMF